MAYGDPHVVIAIAANKSDIPHKNFDASLVEAVIIDLTVLVAHTFTVFTAAGVREFRMLIFLDQCIHR